MNESRKFPAFSHWAVLWLTAGMLVISPLISPAIAFGDETQTENPSQRPDREKMKAHHEAFKACMESAKVTRGERPTEEQRKQVDACLKEKGFDRPPPMPPRGGPGGPGGRRGGAGGQGQGDRPPPREDDANGAYTPSSGASESVVGSVD